MALLEVRDLTMKFGSLVANSDVSFDVEKGTIVGLIGPNGAGKTTLFNCVAGLYKPASGKGHIRRADATGYRRWKMARLGLARSFQVVRRLKEMTVYEKYLVGANAYSDTVKGTEGA
jgi:branched-chain amino acid transport system ATP-binding protein